jgi:3-deoxy-D-manno-octulosonic-acid transferase
MLKVYTTLMGAGAPLLRAVLQRRSERGKEDPLRAGERMGIPGRRRPEGKLIWIHAASVGESQSMLAVVNALLERTDAHVLVTTGTVTSAQMMEKRLPARALHQYYPVDHPQWVKAFLDHWHPDLALWTESELWPAMLQETRRRAIPAVLVNARLSDRSFRRWKMLKSDVKELLETFGLVITQTDDDAKRYRELGARDVVTGGNLKYSAAPLPVDVDDLKVLQQAVANRPLWLYASTHDGEEALACRIHARLKQKIPGLLTLIVPRHPARGESIRSLCEAASLKVRLRENHNLPQAEDDMYIADTLGELGLFYRLAPVACIGRSFSHDGGGGHNPLEAAQLECAVISGPRVQNLAAIYDDMAGAGAAIIVKDENQFEAQLEKLLTVDAALKALRTKGAGYAKEKARVLDVVINAIQPLLNKAGLATHGAKKACA